LPESDLLPLSSPSSSIISRHALSTISAVRSTS
jgi:hypothetical protein